MKKIITWDPEDKLFWENTGRKIARKNLLVSVYSLTLAFIVWQLWSIVAIKLPTIGFAFTKNELFLLASIPALTGSILRFFYSFAIPIFGGKKWTTFCNISLLIPCIGLGFAVQNPNTSFQVMFILALLCGFGGANFSSSMSNISYFYPKSEKGKVLGINAGIGNLGVSILQFVIPLVITLNVFGSLAGGPQQLVNDGGSSSIWLQNAGFIWVPFIIISIILSWLCMDDLPNIKSSVKDQLIVLKRKHTWVLCLLYVGAFGSFIGFSAGFGLLSESLFPTEYSISFLFLGPFIGSLTRVLGGTISDKISPSKITQFSYFMMIFGVIGVIGFIPNLATSYQGNFIGFFISFMFIFAATGIASGSVFAQAPKVFYKWHQKFSLKLGNVDPIALKESAIVVGIMGAVGGLGGFFIPKLFGTSINFTGNPLLALYTFIVFYIVCLVVNWLFYIRKKSITSID